MPFKAWIIKKGQSKDWAFILLLAQHLLKKNPANRIRILLNSFAFWIGSLEWKAVLHVTHRLNRFRESSLMCDLRKFCCKQIPFLRKYYYESAQPANLRAQDVYLFANNFYLLKPLKILHLNNACLHLTSFSGIVFQRYRILPESIHGWWAKTRITVFRNYYRDTMNAWLRARFESDSAIEILDSSTTYLHVHHWFNYYHWLTESLVRLWIVKDNLSSYTLLLPEGLKQLDFVQESLMAFNVKKIHWVKEGAVARVPKLTLVENKPYCNHYDPGQMQALGQFFRTYAVTRPARQVDFGEKVFITRRNAPRRKLKNEQEIEELLTRHGFISVPIEQYSLPEEILIMSKAKYLIGMHGAGLTNMLFMPPGGKVLELHREVNSGRDMHSDVYWKLASALGHSYYYQFCKPADPAQNFFESDLVVDKVEFEVTCKSFLSQNLP